MAIRALHILILAAFALAQPLFDLLGRNVEFLLAHGLDGFDLLLLALVLVAGIPGAIALAIGVLEWVLGRVLGPQARLLHAAAVASLVALIVLPVGLRGSRVVRLDGSVPGWLVVSIAAALGVVAAACYVRWANVRRFVTVSSVGLLAFPLHFFFVSPVREILRPPPAADLEGELASDVSVVVLVFDGLPLSTLVDESGAIDRHRFPHFAALADEAQFFRNATTVSETTDFAIPAIVTGRYPEWDRPPTSAMYPQNLFTFFARTHDLNVFEPVTRLCPRELCAAGPAQVSRAERLAGAFSDLGFIYAHAVLPADLAGDLPGVSAAWRDFADRTPGDSGTWYGLLRSRRSDMGWVFSEFLERIVDRGRPSLHFLHANVPHDPYKYLPSGTEYPTAAIHPNTRKHGGDPLDVDWAETQALQRHLLQVGYADTLLGALRARLKREGLYDRSLLIVTADHGMSFKPGVPSRQLDRKLRNAADLLLVPLLIKLPGQREGQVSDRNAEIVDVLPTLVHVLGGRLAEPVDGIALFDESASRLERKVVYRTHRQSPAGGRRGRAVFPADLPYRNDTVKRISHLFGRGADADLFDVGPHRELMGRRVSALRVEPEAESPFVAHLVGRSDYDDVDTASGFLPALVRGTVTRAGDFPGFPEALDLAVTLNGTVRALTRSFEPTAESVRFAAMLPERAFRNGPNQVEVFVVRDRSTALTTDLTTDSTVVTDLSIFPASVRPAVTYAVAKAHDGTLAVVVASEGRLVPVVRNAVRGHVIRRGEAFTGGAFDVRRSRVADVVVMFEDGRFRLAHRPRPGRKHTFERETPHPAQVTIPEFEFSLPDLAPDEGPDARLRFVALSEDVASELGYRTHFRLLGAWPGDSVELAVEEREGSEGIAASSGGAWIPLEVAGGIRGRFETLLADDGGIEISGWAVDETNRSVPRAALVFVDAGFAGTVPILRTRSDIAAKLGSPEFRDCGFEIALPPGGSSNSAAAAVRVFVPLPAGSVAELAGP